MTEFEDKLLELVRKLLEKLEQIEQRLDNKDDKMQRIKDLTETNQYLKYQLIRKNED